MTMPALKRQVAASYDEVLTRVPEALQAEGFGVLTEVDVHDVLKKKIDVDFRRYKIFGACNPKLAHGALEYDLDIGVLLPCNVVVYEGDDQRAVVSAIDPIAAIAKFGGPELQELAVDIRARLERVLEKVG